MDIDWSMSPYMERMCQRVALRAKSMQVGWKNDVRQTSMDLTFVHKYVAPLNWAKLLDAADSDFAHDLNGIYANLDRNGCEMKNHFLPRCAKLNKERT